MMIDRSVICNVGGGSALQGDHSDMHCTAPDTKRVCFAKVKFNMPYTLRHAKFVFSVDSVSSSSHGGYNRSYVQTCTALQHGHVGWLISLTCPCGQSCLQAGRELPR